MLNPDDLIELLGSTEWGQWHNTGSADVAPFEVFAGTDLVRRDEQLYVSGKRPDGTFRAEYFVNGPFPVAADSYGYYQRGVEVQVAYDGDDPSIGDELGTKSGQGTVVANVPSCITVRGIVNSTNKIALGRLHEIRRTRRVKGTLDSALAFGDATVNLSNVLPTDGDPCSFSTLSGVNNPFHFMADSGADCRAEIIIAKGASDQWELVQVALTQQIMMTDLTNDGNTFTKKTRVVVGMFGSESSSSFDFSASMPSLDTVDAIVDLQINGYTFQKKTRTVYGPSSASTTDWSTWATGASCSS